MWPYVQWIRSYDTSSYSKGSIVVSCKLTGSLTTGAPPGDLVRFSFTNTDVAGVTPAYGWWDVAPPQVEDCPGQPLLRRRPQPAEHLPELVSPA